MSDVGTGVCVNFPNSGKIKLGAIHQSGGSSFVYEAFDAHGTKLAVKVVRANAKEDGIPQRVKNEINNPLPPSPRIVKPIDHIIIESYGLKIPCILFNFSSSKEVADFITVETPRKAAMKRRLNVARNMALSLQHVHSHGFIHGDVSPKNFLLDSENDAIQMIDFETLTRIGGAPLKRTWANKDYMAPEVDQHGSMAISLQSDIWSFALLLIEWLAPEIWKRDNLDEGWAAKFNRRKVSGSEDILQSIVTSPTPLGLNHIWPWIVNALSIEKGYRPSIKKLLQCMDGEEL